LNEARQSLQDSLTILDASPNPDERLLANAKNDLATTLRDLGEIEAAQRLFAESRAGFEALNDAAGLAAVAVNEAEMCRQQGRHAQARELSQKALALYRPLNAPGLLVAPLASLGGSNVELGLYDEAQACFTEALEYARQSGNRLMIASLENHLGVLEPICARRNRWLRKSVRSKSWRAPAMTWARCTNVRATLPPRFQLSKRLWRSTGSPKTPSV
jgi:tetratricopeptide (TPR) repeat protein